MSDSRVRASVRARICVALIALIGAFDRANAVASIADGVRLFETGQYAEAKKFFQATAGDGAERVVGDYYLGRIAIATEDFDEAIRRLEQATAGAPSNSDYHLWLGRALGEKAFRASALKKPFLAGSIKDEFETAVELDPNSLDARTDLMRFYLMAPGILGGSIEKAKAQAAEVLKRDAARGHRLMARVHEEAKEFDQAEHEYLAAMQVTPGDKPTRYALGYFYQARENYDRAFETFEALVRADEAEWPAYYQIGRTGVLSGTNLDRAEQCLTIYIANVTASGNPTPAWAHYRLGMVYEKKGDKLRARRAYEAALQLQQDHKEAKAALKKLS